MKLARLTTILLLAAIALPAAHAEEPTVDQKVATIIDSAIPPDQLLSGPFPRVLQLTQIDGIAEPYQQAAQSRIQEILLAEMDEARIEQRRQLASVLISVFSEEEIDALFDFFSSPAGRSIVAKRQIFGDKIFSTLIGEKTTNYARLQKAIATDPEIQRLKQLSHSGK